MPMGRLYFTLLTGVIAAPFMYLGLSAMDSWLRDCHGGVPLYRIYLLCFEKDHSIAQGGSDTEYGWFLHHLQPCRSSTDKYHEKWDIFSPCKVGSFVGNGRNVPSRCACVREENKIERIGEIEYVDNYMDRACGCTADVRRGYAAVLHPKGFQLRPEKLHRKKIKCHH